MYSNCAAFFASGEIHDLDDRDEGARGDWSGAL
jgi:hypothetical protein